MKQVAIYINNAFFETKIVHSRETSIIIQADESVCMNRLCNINSMVHCKTKMFKQKITEHRPPNKPGTNTPMYMPAGWCYFRAYFVSDEIEIIDGRIELKKD